MPSFGVRGPAGKDFLMSQNQYAKAIKTPGQLSDRVKWLRDYYFEGTDRPWNNEYTVYTTGTPWDVQFDEISYFIVPET